MTEDGGEGYTGIELCNTHFFLTYSKDVPWDVHRSQYHLKENQGEPDIARNHKPSFPLCTYALNQHDMFKFAFLIVV